MGFVHLRKQALKNTALTRELFRGGWHGGGGTELQMRQGVQETWEEDT